MAFFNKSNFYLFIIILIGSAGIYAQGTVNATGGNSKGVNGDVSYSIGQLLYTSYTGTNGSASHGVQLPKEILIVLGVDDIIDLPELTIYPNPVTEYLKLNIKKLDWQDLHYDLYDMQGRSLRNERFKGNITFINLKDLSPAVYFLRINNNKKTLKNFKIIKSY